QYRVGEAWCSGRYGPSALGVLCMASAGICERSRHQPAHLREYRFAGQSGLRSNATRAGTEHTEMADSPWHSAEDVQRGSPRRCVLEQIVRQRLAVGVHLTAQVISVGAMLVPDQCGRLV